MAAETPVVDTRFHTGAVETHCAYCALQCGMTLTVEGDHSSVEVTPRDFPTNRGGLCQKGWTAAELLQSPRRLTAPLMRDSRGEALREVSWDTALDAVADRIRAVQTTHGDDAVAVFGGGGLTNEKAYQLGKFARVALRTSNIDYNGRYCMSSAAAASNRAFGIDRGLPFPLPDLAQTGAVLLMGGNVAETMPPFMQYLNAVRDAGGSVIVADPRRTATAEQATLHLQPLPGTDLALALGLLHIAVADGHVDRDYITARTTGFDDVWRVATQWWPERAERVTGVPVAAQRATVRALAEGRAGRGAVILTARGAEQHSKGTDTVTALINLGLALGLPGRPHSGYGCITGQGNGQGGREHGQKADQLPGYRKIDDPAAREHVARVWGVDPDALPGPGRSAYELIESLGTDGGPRMLLVHGSNLVVSSPRGGRVAERLAALDLLVVCDLFLSETAALADIVLPVTQWAEEDGTMTNLEGRVIRRRAAVPPPAGVRTELEVMADLAARLGRPGGFSTDPRTVFEELRRASAGGVADYSGITWERIEAEDGVFWPCPSVDAPGQARLFTDGTFPTPDGRARFVAVDHRAAGEDIDDDHPIYLTTGRILQQYQSGAQTRHVEALRSTAAEPYLEIHPDLAAWHGLRDGDRVRIVSRRGEALAKARLTASIRSDTVFMPFHWGGEQAVNRVTNAALDPTSRMPEFKVCAVRLQRVDNQGSLPATEPSGTVIAGQA
ncbi:molybdopterin oxidoreductase family protein [Phytoactinopolyspora halotolerans]|uniref:Molybdopterin oxidoreductase family protein n=1 Tax=Phytoactinopolyspora halotolerans TaxID=1981512 RepID=A0A6L9S2U1_9ACTN|nr:molybdopterin oxidoreductase family protein [Phytoactinopolyspora halotolerans]NED99368.1 molybdopterin oxidoreductase family protein [Phytoactinopolyspora halotolerans]